jgi:adenosyl cobinamide kinase/adenosyl cobinamide phosphate guanylyltransferase
MLTLVIGGARSGKSRFALSLGCQAERPTYIATARSNDAATYGVMAGVPVEIEPPGGRA